MAIANQANEFLFGLTFLKTAKASLIFSEKCIDIYLNGFKTESVPQRGGCNVKFTLPYPHGLKINSKQMKTINFYSSSFIDQQTLGSISVIFNRLLKIR